ncbi:MAG TPA: UDP-N-acetylmuramate--L-alanine ligase [Syntrophales bacterium]|nr:UDP-N-acetylmuramate--L-alanine ligase [Syntrophales bacterium]
MVDPLKRDFMRRKIRDIHFVGIGGIGMSGIAEVLLNLGYRISGSDLQPSDLTDRLFRLGARIFQGHDRENVGNADVVVTSTAIREDNPEVREARARNIFVIPRAEMLAELLKMKFSVAVSGCHGKTTTTSMISTILAHGGMDPTMVIGGKLAMIGGNARLGDGEVIVAEADESDGSFLKLLPSIAVITNIDREHLDHYAGIEEIKEAFVRFANLVPFYGTTILCLDDEHVRAILPAVKRRFVTYGLSPDASYRAVDIRFEGRGSRFTLCHGDRVLGPVEMNVPGLFNILNAMAAVAVARELELAFPVIREGLVLFTGVHRRLEIKGEAGGVLVVDDYGHHPTEIRATLKAAREAWKGRRLVVVFQPHRYTRTRALFDEFTAAFGDADALAVMDIYAASETPIEGVHAEILAEAIGKKGKTMCRYAAGPAEVADFLAAEAVPGDVVLTMGAGNVWKTGMSFLEWKKGSGE